MKFLNLLKKQISPTLKDYKKLIPIIGILFIPLIYAGMFLWAFWDPYHNVDKLPVAVVNEDKGMTFNGKQMNIGKDLVDDLKKGKDFKWDFVSEKDAAKGLKDRKYYFEIKLPKDFSKKASTVLDKTPEKPSIQFIQNQGTNYLATKISDSAIEKIKAELGDKISKEYVTIMANKIKKVGDGLGEAASGTQDIKVGMDQAIKGTNDMLTQVENKTQSINSLAKGSNDLSNGTKQLTSGIQQLDSGMSSLEQGSGKLTDSAGLLVDSTDKMKSSVTKLDNGAKTLAQGEKALLNGLLNYQSINPSLKNDPYFQALIANATKISEGMNLTSDGTSSLVQGVTALNQGLKDSRTGQMQLDAGIMNLKTGSSKALEGAKQVEYGSIQVSNGNEEVKNGWTDLSSGLKDLNNGQEKIQKGSITLHNKLADGQKDIKDTNLNETNIEMMSSPLTIVHKPMNKVPNYGTGFAPYFLSLGLFVGALIISIVVDFSKYLETPRTAIEAFIVKGLPIIVIGFIQTLIVDVVVLKGLNLEVKSLSGFILSSLLVSTVFISLIHLLVVTLKDVGRFLAIIILILQLTSSAGTYPLEMLPHQLQFINHLLPMTYVLFMFKSVISSGDISFAYHNAFILLGYLVVFALGTITYLKIKLKKLTTN